MDDGRVKGGIGGRWAKGTQGYTDRNKKRRRPEKGEEEKESPSVAPEGDGATNDRSLRDAQRWITGFDETSAFEVLPRSP